MATILGKLPPERIQQIRDDIRIREARGMLDRKTDEEFIEQVCKAAEIESPYKATEGNNGAARETTPVLGTAETKENSKLLSLILHLRRLSSSKFSGLVILSMYRGSLSPEVRQYESDKIRLRKLNLTTSEEQEKIAVKTVEEAITKETTPTTVEILKG